MADRRTILLVEDEVLIAFREKQLLEREGFQVFHALDGESAVETVCAQNAPVDLILMDINLGAGMDGTQAAQRILQTRDVPVIFLSSHTEKEVVEKTEEITSYGYIVKNSSPTVLFASIKMAFKLHKAHMQLRESEDRYRTLVEHSPDGIGIYYEDRVVYVNSAAVRMCNARGPEDLLGLRVLDFVHPDSRALIEERMRQYDPKRLPTEAMEDRYLTLNGVVLEAELVTTPIMYDGKPATQVIVHDISGRKRAEQELRESEERLRQIITQMPYPAEICDPDGTARMVNQAFLDLFGIPSAELVVGHYNVFQDALVMDALGLAPQIRRAYAGETVFVPEITLPARQIAPEYQSQETDDIILEATMFAVFRTTGEIGHVVTIWKDITERKRVEAEREMLLAQVTAARDEVAKAKDLLNSVMERVSDGIVAFDKEFNYTYVNTYGAELLMGRKVEELIGKNYWVEYPEARGTPFANAYVRAMQTQQPIIFEDYYEHWDRWFGNRIYPSPDGITIFFNDITNLKRSEMALRSSQERLRLITETIQEVFWMADVKIEHMLYISPSYEQVWGRSCESLYQNPRSFLESMHPEDRARGMAEAAIERTGQPFDSEYRIIRPDGAVRWIWDRGFPVFSATGEVACYVGIARDITERKEMETQLREAEARYRDIFENAIEGMFQSTPGGRFLRINAAMARIYGYDSPEEMLETIGDQIAVRLYAYPDGRAELARVLEQAGAINEYEIEHLRKDGSRIWVRISARVIRDPDGEVLYYEGFMEDITQRKQAEEALQETNAILQAQLIEIQALHETLQYEAVRDSLTGLYNRRYLFETLDRELARARREEYPVSVMMVDVDHFKDFNDRHGHQAGDEVLRKLGALFRREIRQSDIACRYGGEEFVIIMPRADDGDTERRADSIRASFSGMPVEWEGQELFASISIGIAFYPRHGTDVRTMIKAADGALYEAKRAGRNRVFAWKDSFE